MKCCPTENTEDTEKSLSSHIDVLGWVVLVLLLGLVLVGWLALGLVAVAVGGGVEGVGAFDLVLQGIALQGGVLAEVLDAADVLVLGRRFGRLDLSALNDRAGEGVDLTHGWPLTLLSAQKLPEPKQKRLRFLAGGAFPGVWDDGG